MRQTAMPLLILLVSKIRGILNLWNKWYEYICVLYKWQITNTLSYCLDKKILNYNYIIKNRKNTIFPYHYYVEWFLIDMWDSFKILTSVISLLWMNKGSVHMWTFILQNVQIQKLFLCQKLTWYTQKQEA